MAALQIKTQSSLLSYIQAPRKLLEGTFLPLALYGLIHCFIFDRQAGIAGLIKMVRRDGLGELSVVSIGGNEGLAGSREVMELRR